MSSFLRNMGGEDLRVGAFQGREIALRLARPLVTSQATMERRRVLIVVCKLCAGGADEAPVCGFGEAAPLVGWSEESVDDCLTALGTIEEATSGMQLDEFEDVLNGLSTLPSLRFALEGAIIDGLARRRGLCLRDIFVDVDPQPVSTPDSIAVQAVIGDGDKEQTVAAVKAAIKGGAKALKLKVGVASAEEDFQRLATVRRRFPQVTLRVDANGAWSVDEARWFLDRVEALNVDLVEQPVDAGKPRALLKLARQFEVAVAADESCTSMSATKFLVDEGIDAVAIKPGALGGMLEVRALIKYAVARDVRVVLSSLIESAVGRRTVAELAGSCCLPGPHGLGTGEWLSEDISPDRDCIANGRLQLASTSGLGFEPVGIHLPDNKMPV